MVCGIGADYLGLNAAEVPGNENLLEPGGEIVVEFQPDVVGQAVAGAMLHLGAARHEEQLVGAETNKGSDG